MTSFGGTGGGLIELVDATVVFCCCSAVRFASRSPILVPNKDDGIFWARVSMRNRSK